MTDAIARINALSSSWVDTVLAVLWQSTLLALAVAAVLTAWHQLSPRARCWIWRLVAIKLFLLPFWIVTVPIAVPQSQIIASAPAVEIAPTQVTHSAISAAGNGSELQSTVASSGATTTADAPVPPLTWQSWLVVLWGAVLLVQVVRILGQRWRLNRLLAAAQPADEAICRIVTNCSSQLRLTYVPQTRITEAEVSPFVCRWMQPVLILPESMTEACDTAQWRQIVLHELAHVRRGDLLWCWITHIVRMLYWFHPVAHWAAFRESLERELACDELAMTYSGATAADYARTLIEAATRLAQPAVFRAVAVSHLDGGVAIRNSQKSHDSRAFTPNGEIP